MMGDKPILFFDSDCLLCNRSVQWLILRDRNKQIQFAPLQGKTATDLLPFPLIQELNTLVLWENGQIFTKSSAIFKAMSYLDSPWNNLAFIKIIPRFLSDFLYRLVAKQRRRLSKKNPDSCLIGHQERILP